MTSQLGLQRLIADRTYHDLVTSKGLSWTPPAMRRRKWTYIFTLTREEQDRLEWTGDGLFSSALISVMHQVFPGRPSTFYPPIHKALSQNCIFAALWVNAGVPRAEVEAHPKAYADMLEVIVAVYVDDGDLEPLKVWVKRTFYPLLYIARKAMMEYHTRAYSPATFEVTPLFETSRQKRRRSENNSPTPQQGHQGKRARSREVTTAFGEVTNLGLVALASSSRIVPQALPVSDPETPPKPMIKYSMHEPTSPSIGTSRHRPIDLSFSP
ncbi:hypothetical protein Hypma_010624 [Hypsizygus marmoreus]|uniref:RNase III domain-containing protein n=1 Tax=Hypsizygus marmoreus TaxID=39966 RepID=A0A369JM53_HYPMA|nr:hypothetical protein Hypma_010624 [Hypsizygus marmoreus]